VFSSSYISQLRARQPLIRLQIFRLRLGDHIRRQRGRRRLFVPGQCFQIIAHELFVETWLAVAGTIFIGQGLGIIRGSSFMVDDQRWALIGLVMDLAASGIAWVTFRARS